MFLRPGDKFRIKLYKDQFNPVFLGYVKYSQVQDHYHKEWITELGSKNSGEAAIFQLIGMNEISGLCWPTVKGLVPGVTPDDSTELSYGDYKVARGRGGEFNPLLFNTVEFTNSDKWALLTGGSTVCTISTDTLYIAFSFVGLNFIIGTDALTFRLGILTEIVRISGHGRKSFPGQLRFGTTLGNPEKIKISFELV